MNPIIKALKTLGGSGTIEEINSKVFEISTLTDEQLEVSHDEKGGMSEVEYRLAWARTYLKKYDVLENSRRGVWALTSKGKQINEVNVQEVKKFVKEQGKKTEPISINGEIDDPNKQLSWQEEVLKILHQIEPTAFERLAQRILRESGFTQVEVTGRKGDEGIDGKGIMRLGGLLSFHVIFQCKRYKGSVSSDKIRDFRGAMVGRADKGLFITTGKFTRDAVKEATRDGAPTIDLIDGDQLVEKLKELNLGVQTRKIEIEQVVVNKDWLLNI
jgi:restriction system protein